MHRHCLGHWELWIPAFSRERVGTLRLRWRASPILWRRYARRLQRDRSPYREQPARTAHVRSARAVPQQPTRIELPDQLHAVLVQVAEALNQGLAVSVIPQSARLTTQQAADYLGVSRPTIVRLLERGEIPMTKPGRHRYVQLQDLVTYREAMRDRRRDILDAMTREAEDLGLYEATDGPPPPMR